MQDLSNNTQYTKGIYTPWDDTSFKHKISGTTFLSPYRLWILSSMCLNALDGGNVAECGVWHGGSAKFLFNSLQGFFPKDKNLQGKTFNLFLCDTFSGMPKCEGDPSGHKEGDLKVSLDEVKKLMGDHDNVHYLVGEVEQTLDSLKDKKFDFVHVDLDLEKSTEFCFNFFLPKLTPKGVIICDDYGWKKYIGAKRAVDRVIKQHASLVLDNGQIIVFNKPS